MLFSFTSFVHSLHFVRSFHSLIRGGGERRTKQAIVDGGPSSEGPSSELSSPLYIKEEQG